MWIHTELEVHTGAPEVFTQTQSSVPLPSGLVCYVCHECMKASPLKLVLFLINKTQHRNLPKSQQTECCSATRNEHSMVHTREMRSPLSLNDHVPPQTLPTRWFPFLSHCVLVRASHLVIFFLRLLNDTGRCCIRKFASGFFLTVLPAKACEFPRKIVLGF